MGGFEDDCLAAHNTYRRKHGVPGLKYNRQVAAIAQKWAEELARSGRFQHSQDRKVGGEQLGENIAMKWTSNNQDFTGKEVTKQWYDEISKYDFSRHGGPGTGHFTQVVWKDSRELGVGRAQGRDGKWIVVANYMPAGNWVGRNAQNVFPPGGSRAGGQSDSSSSSDDDRPSHRPRPAASSSAHQPHPAVSLQPIGGGRQTRTVTTESHGRDSSSPKGYRKCVVTETTIGPDGQKRTVTRETVTHGGRDSPDDFHKRFEDLRKKHGFSDSSRNNNDPFRDHDFQRFESSSGDFDKQKKQWEKERKEREKQAEKERKEREKQAERERKERGGSGEARGRGGQGEGKNMKEFIEDVVKCHNRYRKKHGKVGDLKHSRELTELAQRWAEHLAATSVLKHSNDCLHGQQLGENVATKWSSAGADYNGQDVTDQWYKEVEKYDFRRNDYSSGTGHFTQIVWKGSKEVGVGKAFGRDGRVFVVCNYLPAGNVMGHFRENVFPG